MRGSTTSKARRIQGIVLALVIAGAVAPASADHEPLVDVSLGNTYEQSFNGNDGGFTSVTPPAPPTHDWQLGVPTSGPNVASSGQNVWATNLSGLYRANDCGGIVSPAIDLSAAAAASISFQQWRHIEEGTTTAFDAGMLFVSTDDGTTWTKVTPAGGYTSKAIGTTTRACLFGQPTGALGLSGPTGTVAPPPTYSPVSVDLTPFAGNTVRFMIAFGSDGSVHRTGWYVDDVTVTVDESSTTQDFENGAGGWTTKNLGVPKAPLGWSWGTNTNGPSGVDGSLWATNPTGNYGPNECSSITSPAIDLSSPGATKATLRWQQWFRSLSTAGGVIQASNDGATWKNLVPTAGYGTGNPTAVLDACLGDDTQGSGGFSGSINVAGAPMADYAADVSGYLGGNLHLRFLFASTDSASVNEGWYIDNLSIERKLYAGAPHPPELPLFGPGWSTDGTANSWQYGAATTGPVGETVFATNLGGAYNPSECSYIQSPAVPGALLTLDPALRFEHWYKIESTSATGSAYDGGIVLASTDDGATWSYLDLPGYTKPAFSTTLKACLAGYGLPATTRVFSGSKEQFDLVTADLSAFATSPSVRFRFVFGSDSSVHYDGWYIKNISVAGVTLVP